MLSSSRALKNNMFLQHCATYFICKNNEKTVFVWCGGGGGRGAAQHLSIPKNNAKSVFLSWWGAGRGAAQHISVAKNNENMFF